MPNIFHDFRNHMAELIAELNKEGVNDESMLTLRLKSKINEQLKHLNKEQKIAIKSLGIKALGTPIISIATAFAINQIGFDITSLITVGATGLINLSSLREVSNYLKTREELKANSMYFLWQAQKDKNPFR